MSTAMKRLASIAAALISALPALAAEPSEHWRCGPYDIRIVPGNSYIPGEYIVLDDDGGIPCSPERSRRWARGHPG